jgi:hypothetical protein
VQAKDGFSLPILNICVRGILFLQAIPMGPQNASSADLWLEDNKKAHIYLFLSFIGFAACTRWPLFSLFPRRRRRQQQNAATATAQLSHAFAAQVHALVSLALSARSLLRMILLSASPSSSSSSSCDATAPTELCWDPLLARQLDFHAGFLIFEALYYHHVASTVRLVPRFPYLLLHNTIGVVCYIGCRMSPCSLTATLVPLYGLLAAAQLVHAKFEVAMAEIKPFNARLNALVNLATASLLRWLAAVAYAMYSYYWLVAHNALNAPSSLLYIGGGVGLALIYMKWFYVANGLLKRTQAAVAQRPTVRQTRDDPRRRRE